MHLRRGWGRLAALGTLAAACAARPPIPSRAPAPVSQAPAAAPRADSPELARLDREAHDGKRPLSHRREAIERMAALEDGKAGERVRALIHEPSLEAALRAEAMRALGQREGKAAVGELEGMLAAPEASLREAAALVLGSLGGPEARDCIVGRLESEEDPSVREALQQSLAQMEP